MFNPQRHTTEFVLYSDIIADLENGEKEDWNFQEADSDFSYGDNNRTLIRADRLLSHIRDNELDCPGIEGRIAALPDDLYIDVEN